MAHVFSNTGQACGVPSAKRTLRRIGHSSLSRSFKVILIGAAGIRTDCSRNVQQCRNYFRNLRRYT